MTESGHFFFTEVDRLMPQTQTSPAFGSIDHTKFRTTYNFKIKTETNSSGAKAYAPFNGKVILMDYNPEGELVNLMLVPRGAGLYKGFTPGIRCVIFRGIDRLDYFPDSESVIITKAQANAKAAGSVFKRCNTLNVTSELADGADLITKKNLDLHNDARDSEELITEVIRLSPSIAWFKKGEVLGSAYPKPKESYSSSEYNEIIQQIYRISLPEAYLYSDVDSFGLFRVYKYLQKSSKVNPVKLSEILSFYYVEGEKYILDEGSYVTSYHKRWHQFSRKWIGKDSIATHLNTSSELFFQGFLDSLSSNVTKNFGLNNDQSASYILLKKYGILFANFWYQATFILNQPGIAAEQAFFFIIFELIKNSENLLPLPPSSYYPPINLNQINFMLGTIYSLLQKESINRPVLFEKYPVEYTPAYLQNLGSVYGSSLEITEVISIFKSQLFYKLS